MGSFADQMKDEPICGHLIFNIKCRHCNDLQKKCYQKLKDSDWDDIEDLKGRIKPHDRRTSIFDDREEIREFFLTVDSFLNHAAQLPEEHRLVLELYSQGLHIRQIAFKLECGRTKIHGIIKYYKQVLLASN